MAKSIIPDEVQVLRFFETGSLERAEVLFNIVSEKMRERLRGAPQDRPAQTVAPRRRTAAQNPRAAGLESGEQPPPA
jgi:hypothetical protein